MSTSHTPQLHNQSKIHNLTRRTSHFFHLLFIRFTVQIFGSRVPFHATHLFKSCLFCLHFCFTNSLTHFLRCSRFQIISINITLLLFLPFTQIHFTLFFQFLFAFHFALGIIEFLLLFCFDNSFQSVIVIHPIQFF